MELQKPLSSGIPTPESISIQRVSDDPDDKWLRAIIYCERAAVYRFKGTRRKPRNESPQARERKILMADAEAAERRNWWKYLENSGSTGVVFHDAESGLSTEVDLVASYGEEKKNEVGILFLKFPPYFMFKRMAEKGIPMSIEDKRRLLLSTAIIARNGLKVVDATIWHICFFGGNEATFGRRTRGVIKMGPIEKKEASDLYFAWLNDRETSVKQGILPPPTASSWETCKTCHYSNTCRLGRSIIPAANIKAPNQPLSRVEQLVLEGLADSRVPYDPCDF